MKTQPTSPYEWLRFGAAICNRLYRQGPVRVLVDEQGKATSNIDARALGILPEFIFIRNDGWTLGAPWKLIKVAHSLWKEEWIAWTTQFDVFDVKPMYDADLLEMLT